MFAAGFMTKQVIIIEKLPSVKNKNNIVIKINILIKYFSQFLKVSKNICDYIGRYYYSVYFIIDE